MFICEIWLFDWYFPQFCTTDMSKYGYLEVFQRVPSTSRYLESTVFVSYRNKNIVFSVPCFLHIDSYSLSAIDRAQINQQNKVESLFRTPGQGENVLS